ncbi:MAG TPA: hypothetical protein VGJ20_36360 [Xanthobacteraceae bacterium]|jgi:hypothetical protein
MGDLARTVSLSNSIAFPPTSVFVVKARRRGDRGLVEDKPTQLTFPKRVKYPTPLLARRVAKADVTPSL